MKALKKILLINWHSFSKELIEVGNINFLTGKNAAGKSTIVDAIQLVILGDTRGSSFNKAASEKSGRTVISYLRGEIGEDENGNKKYLRNGDFASYVCLEFYDDINNQSFVVGIQYDISGEKLFPHQFIYDGEIPEDCFIADKTAMQFKAFKEYISVMAKSVDFAESLTSFKENLRKKLGQLSTRFFSLFKKAVPFQPIYDIRKFITEFVCDVKFDIKGDLEKMNENIRNYTTLEDEARIVEQKVAMLNRIHELYGNYATDKTKIEQAQYLVDRLEILKTKKEITNVNKRIDEYNGLLEATYVDQDSLEKELKDWNKIRDDLIGKKESSNSSLLKETYGKDKLYIEKEIEQVKLSFDKSREHLANLYNRYVALADEILRTSFDSELLEEAGVDADRIYKSCETIKNNANRLKEIDESNINTFTLDSFVEMNSFVSQANELFNKVRNFVDSMINSLDSKKQSMSSTIESLKSGNKNYPLGHVEFKRLVEETLSARHNRKVQVNFVADLMEVKDKSWQDVLEVYLNAQKLALVVDNEYFYEALQIYHDNRDRFSNIMILDCKKIYERSPFNTERNALSNEIYTDNKYVRAYIDMLIGELIKVNSVNDLNKYDRAITQTGMLYQQFAVRQMNMNPARNPFIGRKASESQIENYKQEIIDIGNDIEKLKAKSSDFYSLCHFEDVSNVELNFHFNNLKRIYELDELKAELENINHSIENIDTSDVSEFEAKIMDADKEIKQLNAKRLSSGQDQMAYTLKIADLRDDKLANLEKKLIEQEHNLEENYTNEWVEANVAPDINEKLEYISENELSKRLAESRELNNTLASKKRAVNDARLKYLNTFHVTLDIMQDNNDAFDSELNKYEVIELPAYIEKIAVAKDKTYEEFKEDLLAKLKSQIESVQEQIEVLNSSLSNFKFGRDKYEFLVKSNPTYQRIYDMIMDELLMKDSRNNSQAFYEKYKDTINEFFDTITSATGTNDEERKQMIDQNINRLTDYRTYLDFDLLVHNQDTGSIQSLANTMNTKSGGETQTPFYISILASIANEYRIGLDDASSNTPRLILFDEAFNKMDSERIRESIEMLKRFNLQAILVAPTEKVSDIAPLVDKTISVIRRKNNAFVKVFGKEQIADIEG